MELLDVQIGTEKQKTPILKRYYGLIPGLIALAVYYSTTCRSIWIGDSGEFALVLKCLGIAHPPGYPLFTLLGRVFLLAVPFVRPIFAAGLFNVLLGAATAVVFYYIFRRRLDGLLAGILSLLWAFSPLFWSETAGAEIYVLNMLLLSLVFLTTESSRYWRWPLAIYLFGLSLSNHPSALSFVPALMFLFIRERQYRRWKLLPVHLSLLALAATPYLYLLIRSPLNPVSNWGRPDSLTALINHMTLEQYRGWVHNSWENLFVSFRLFFISILKSWWWLGIIATVTGAVTGWRTHRPRTISALLIMAANLVLSASHEALNYEPFYLPSMFAALILIGNNFDWIKRRRLSGTARLGIRTAAVAAVGALLLLNYQELDKSDYTLAEDYGRLIIDTAGRGILFVAGDINSFPTLYLRYAEGYGQHLEVFDRSTRAPALLDKAYQLTGREFNDYYSAREAVIRYAEGEKYLVKNHYLHEPHWLKLSKPIFSYGILYAVQERPAKMPTFLKYPPDYDPGDPLSRQLLANLDLARGEEALQSKPADLTAAQEAFSMAIDRMNNEPRARVLNEIGIYFRQAGQLQLALDTYRRALEKPLITPRQRRDIIFNISNIHKDRGNAHLQAGDYRRGVASYLEALKYDQDNPRLLLNIGMIYARRLNDTSNALVYLNEYLKLNPSETEIRNLVKSLRN